MARLTRILGIRFPIILGAMRGITMGEMAAAISENGGFGQIATSGLTADELREQIQKARRLTDHPFGVNIPLHRPNAFEFLELAAELGISAITTSGGNPSRIMSRAKEMKVAVLHKVSNISMGRKAEDAGVDGVIATGFEAGGHGGKDQITTLCLVPQLVDALRIPVVASGGIVDGRTLAAAFTLGAEGAEIGTRFLASIECPAKDYYKKAVLAAAANSTVNIGHGAMSIRVLKNMAVENLIKPQGEKEQNLQAMDYVTSEADADTSIMPAGMGAGMICELSSVKNIMADMLAQAAESSQRVRDIFTEDKI